MGKQSYCLTLFGKTRVSLFPSLTKASKKIVEVVDEIPIDRLLVETDCPYMAPVPNRGKRNKSDYIEYIIEQVAEIKKIDPISTNMELNDNFKRLISEGK